MPLPPVSSTSVPTPSAEELKRLERQRRTLSLRKEGWSISDIAAEVGVTEMTVMRDIAERVKMLQWESAEDAMIVRDGILERNMAIIKANWEKVLAGDLSATDRIIAVNKQLADMVIGQKMDIQSDGKPLQQQVKTIEVFLAAPASQQSLPAPQITNSPASMIVGNLIEVLNQPAED